MLCERLKLLQWNYIIQTITLSHLKASFANIIQQCNFPSAFELKFIWFHHCILNLLTSLKILQSYMMVKREPEQFGTVLYQTITLDTPRRDCRLEAVLTKLTWILKEVVYETIAVSAVFISLTNVFIFGFSSKRGTSNDVPAGNDNWHRPCYWNASPLFLFLV